MTTLPVAGAAMTLKSLELHRDWLIGHQRDLELQDFVMADVLNGDWMPRVEHAKHLLDGHTGRVGIHGPFWGFTIDSEDPEVRAIAARRIDQGLSVCEALGATHMVIHSPFTTWSYNHIMNERKEFHAIIERCHQTIGAAVKRAEDIGCELVIENIEDKDPAHRIALADSFNSTAIAISVDTGHAHYAHGSTGAPPVDHYIRIAGARLKHVHLQDADGYGDRHWSLGEGSILWHSVFAALGETDSCPRLIIELRDQTKIPASAAYLAGLGLAI